MMDVNKGLLLIAFSIPAVAGYLLGSLNFAIVVSKLLYKKDIRTLGSGNAGMTNVLRNFDKKGAAMTLGGDVLKGILSVMVGNWVFMLLLPQLAPVYGAYVGGICAILGHMFPVYFGFKGGKGVAVSGGVIIALQPLLALFLLVVFLLVVAVTKMVSLGSVLGIGLYPVVTLLWAVFVTKTAVLYSVVCSLIISLLVIWMHRQNIKRILAGTEYKFGQKKKNEQPPRDSEE